MVLSAEGKRISVTLGQPSDFDLARFLEAQRDTCDTALAELKSGSKRTHWMWFIFPQVRGLGRSEPAQFYAIGGLPEARAYLAHPVLGPRLCECVEAVVAHEGVSPDAIFGEIDALKFRSCVTLFAQADPSQPLFARALEAFFAGEPDPQTLALLGASA